VSPAFFVRGLAIGFSIAAPVGPIGVLCIRRTLTQGRAQGFVSGLGAATADGAYGFVAAFGLTSVTAVLVGQQWWLRLVGGAFLVYLGARIFVSTPAVEAPAVGATGLTGTYASTLFLTLTNPLTILSFAAVFAGLGLGAIRAAYEDAVLIVAGVFLGSALWWAVLTTVVATFRNAVGGRALRWLNRASGAAIAAFGAAALATLAR